MLHIHRTLGPSTPGLPVPYRYYETVRSKKIEIMSASLEFERFIGSNPITNGALCHPDGARYVFSAGGNVVIGDLIDPSAQSFLLR